ncbi:DUF481 domain-containing protein [Phytohalomonas tamaricis]|uniref:DUF481 domain-containing protein n=1 Tax=Phytohalomonas tamaricis TaxID=2081032 RepID=UPI00131A08F9|nr:DUF481 domain-containing protein [Phytohalomonas tamaricis]
MVTPFHHMRLLSLTLSGLGLAVLPLAAHAELEDFSTLDNPAYQTKSFDGNAELGYTKISGNSDSETLLAKTTMTWYHNVWSYSLHAAANSASSDNETSAEEYLLAGRTRYNLSRLNYLFGLARWDKDRFSGYDSQTTLAAGYGRQLLVGPPHSLSVEFGPGVRHDELSDGGNENHGLAYGGLDYAWQVSDTALFSQGLATEITGENIIGRSDTALKVAINDTLSLKLSYEVEFNDSPPADASSQTDTTTAVSVVYNM